VHANSNLFASGVVMFRDVGVVAGAGVDPERAVGVVLGRSRGSRGLLD
jgi:hypothetical protein